MHKAARVSSTYNAGNQGYVKWVNLGKEGFPEARAELGLPSSRIINTDVQKATEFLSSLDLLGLLRFILFWIAGDGCLDVSPVFAESGETVFKLINIKITARDNHILLLFQQSLSRYDLDSHCSSISKNKAGLNVLRIKIERGDASIKRAWMEALESIPANILHPKLSLMKNLFKSPNSQLPLSGFSTRLPFYDFIEGDIDDKLLWVLGQDFHSLNLEAINAILRFAGFRTVTKIQDFNLKTFMQRALQVEPKTQPQQQLFVEYIKQCKTRVTESSFPVNVRPNTFHHGYYDGANSNTLCRCLWID